MKIYACPAWNSTWQVIFLPLSCLFKFTNIQRYIQKHMHTCIYIQTCYSLVPDLSEITLTHQQNETKLKLNRVLQSTYICGLKFYPDQLRSQPSLVCPWLYLTQIETDRGLVCQRYLPVLNTGWRLVYAYIIESLIDSTAALEYTYIRSELINTEPALDNWSLQAP